MLFYQIKIGKNLRNNPSHLAEAYRQKAEKAKHKLVDHLIPMATFAVKRLRGVTGKFEDYVSESYVALELAVTRFRVTNRPYIRWSTYAFMVIRRHLFRFDSVNHMIRPPKGSKLPAHKVGGIIEDKVDTQGIEDAVLDRDSLELAKDLLNAREKQLMILRFEQDLSHREIAEIWNTSHQNVHQTEQRALKKMRKLFDEGAR